MLYQQSLFYCPTLGGNSEVLSRRSAGCSKKNVAQLHLRRIILTQNTGKKGPLSILQANKAFFLFSLYFVLLKNQENNDWKSYILNLK